MARQTAIEKMVNRNALHRTALIAKARREAAAPVVETYSLQCNGRHVRKATQVTLASGRVIRFEEKLSNREAIRQVEKCLAREANGAPKA
jgi:hypothetical protein